MCRAVRNLHQALDRSPTVLLLRRSDVQRVFTVEEAYAAAEEAFGVLARGLADAPMQTLLRSKHGLTGVKPAAYAGMVAVKVVAARPENAERGLPRVPGSILLADDATGMPLAFMDGTFLTERRTAAGSALATRHLAAPGARVLALLGSGAQAREHLRMMRHVLPNLEEIRVASRTYDGARAFAERHGQPVCAAKTVAEAVAGADVVCCCTTAKEPVLAGAALSPRAHVNAVGAYTPMTRELDDETLRRATRVVVDSRDAAGHEAGDLLLPARAGVSLPPLVELGELVVGAERGRAPEDGVTVFKSVGLAIQDLTAAVRVLRAAEKRGLGIVFDSMA